jgi:propane monooxygenase large subunit
MGQLIGAREWETLYHGWNWADVVSDMGFVRDDGKTMVAQPHLTWIPRRCGPWITCAGWPEVLSPNVLLNEWTPEQREAFRADYVRQGPAGRPAPAAS